MTELLFRDDTYLRSCEARVSHISPEGGIVLDRTVFYATSGGQPGDSGRLVRADGSAITIAGAIHPNGDKTTVEHVPAEGQSMPRTSARRSVSTSVGSGVTG